MVITNNAGITRWSRDGRAKEFRYIYDENFALNIRVEEFQRVGRTKSKKSKMLFFPGYINILNPDFQNFVFFFTKL